MSLALRVLSLVLAGAALTIPALRWRRAAFAAFLALGLLSFPVRAGWPDAALAPRACEGVVSMGLALHSFRNVPHLALFPLLFLLARRQFTGPHAGIFAFGTTLAFGAALELAQGLSGAGHCRLRDLLPDAAGALAGWGLWAMGAVGYRRVRARVAATA